MCKRLFVFLIVVVWANAALALGGVNNVRFGLNTFPIANSWGPLTVLESGRGFAIMTDNDKILTVSRLPPGNLIQVSETEIYSIGTILTKYLKGQSLPKDNELVNQVLNAFQPMEKKKFNHFDALIKQDPILPNTSIAYLAIEGSEDSILEIRAVMDPKEFEEYLQTVEQVN